MDRRRLRDGSIRTAAGLGATVPASLPLLDTDLRLRSGDEVAARLLAMNAVAAVAYGFDRAKATEWLRQETLNGALTDTERRFVVDGEGFPDPFRAQIEGMWALAWAIQLVSEMDLAKNCDDRFAAMLPNLKRAESSVTLRASAKLRSEEEIAAACDLAYCLHWSINQAKLDGGALPPKLKANVVIERRRALEWLLSSEEWDEVPLDT